MNPNVMVTEDCEYEFKVLFKTMEFRMLTELSKIYKESISWTISMILKNEIKEYGRVQGL